MCKMLLIFSHKLTKIQKKDAINTFGCSEFLTLPNDLSKIWMQIPPTQPSLREYLQPIKNWINENASPMDFVLIQGEYGASFLIINYVFKMNLIPIYATTERITTEKQMPDGTIKTERVFKHKSFRKYEKE
ncbi:MAG: hypothetical protein HF967_02245 [Methanosarcinales archaeon]|nr:hypothetical protein [Methanosarcinales archaeon]